MPLDRTWYSTLQDDSGSGLDGSIIAKADIDALLDSVDAQGTGDWSAYTPTLTGVTLGNGTISGSKTQHGKVVHFESLIVLGSTSVVTGAITITLPANCIPGSAGQMMGHSVAFDASAGQFYPGTNLVASATAIGLYSGSPLVPYQVTVPFTWATGDQIFVRGTYKAA